MWVASLSLCERGAKGRHSLKVPRAGGGLRALRGRRLQREGETQKQKRRNRDGQRWVALAGRQMAEKFFKKEQRKHKI